MRKILVYGTLKAGHGNHGLLTKATRLGETSVPGKMYSLGAFPGVRLDEPGNIKCEVYEVDDFTLARLDQLEGYRDKSVSGKRNNFYTREPVRFKMDGEFHHGEIYEIVTNFLRDNPTVVESGDWK